MKSIEEQVSEAAEDFANHQFFKKPTLLDDIESHFCYADGFKAGAHFAIPLADKIAEDRTFERVVEALKEWGSDYPESFAVFYADKLLANRDRILGKNEHEERCKHGVHGTDCWTCHPSDAGEVNEGDK